MRTTQKLLVVSHSSFFSSAVWDVRFTILYFPMTRTRIYVCMFFTLYSSRFSLQALDTSGPQGRPWPKLWPTPHFVYNAFCTLQLKIDLQNFKITYHALVYDHIIPKMYFLFTKQLKLTCKNTIFKLSKFWHSIKNFFSQVLQMIYLPVHREMWSSTTTPLNLIQVNIILL